MTDTILSAGAERSDAAPNAAISPARKYYIVFMLTLVSMLALIDRNILSVLLVPIQQEIGASDTAMGLLSGTAFGLFYVTAALPVSWIADHKNRRNLLAVSLAIWSAATSLCGFANSYFHLLLARIGVAGGESASNPATMSMIGDLFSARRRATAIGVTMVGNAVGLFLGASLGGLLNDLYSWRTAFVVLGLPGILTAIVIWLTVPEPARTSKKSEEGTPARQIRQSIATVAGIPTARMLILAKCIHYMGQLAFAAWMPTFLVRGHGLAIGEMGLYFGTANGIGAIIAYVGGGMLSDYLSRYGQRWYLYLCVFAPLGAVPLLLILIFTSFAGPPLVVFMIFYSSVAALSNPASFAVGLTIVPSQTRGFMTALMFFAMNLVGSGLGPAVVGMTSDALKPAYGAESLRYALILIPTLYVVGAFLYFLASRTVERDAALVQNENGAP